MKVDEQLHGAWLKDQQRYEDGCTHDGPHIVDVEVPIGPGTDDTDLGVLRLDDIEARDPNLTTAAVPLPLHIRRNYDQG